jgi:predicted dithiol-disulfide oxidoreductase (DUF899 family)
MTNEISKEIRDLEKEIYDLTRKLSQLQEKNMGEKIPNYKFTTTDGETTLLDLFGDKEKMLMVHNMGQGCRYCTLWADGFNGFISHLETAVSIVLVSKDEPKIQRKFANERGWRFRLASHEGGRYIKEQTVENEKKNMPGAVVYRKDGDQIYRTNDCVFGPGDLYCSIWNLLSLAGFNEKTWTPQFTYWKRPDVLDDGGKNVVD